ncbi:hypothetical protein Ade02nite_34270 [Paractinoplanes deccanensis]|uniref:Uncharacterized protein n=1 Tax=Paractinoplanes deccanensis TaxID=113561 RepID=A0ABQ3Y464_9ACTN|nr:DUF6461 domain-containing protein [Actinoplanes deccanensis]GID74786.1 hypothetical protein Ade02nite_34270 [Actinoplanes deccanensis]
MDLTSGPWGWDSELGYTITFAAGTTPRAALTAYGAGPAGLLTLTWDQTVQRNPENSVRAGIVGDWAFCFEYVGYRATQPGLLARLSAGTEVFSVFHGSGKCFVHAYRDRRRWASFEPGAPRSARGPQARQFAEHTHHLMRSRHLCARHAALEMVAEHLGARVTRRVLAGPLLTAYLPADSHPASPPSMSGHASRRGLGRPIGTLNADL